MASLLILKGANQGQRMPLDGKDRITLGRNRDCTVVIDSPAVSRIHAQIVRVNGKFFIEDGDGKGPSRNSTFVNNQKIAAQTQLKDNDRVKICDFLFTFHDGTAPLKVAPEELPEEEQAEPEGSSTVEATVGSVPANQLLESQPTEKLTALLEISTYLSKTLELDTLMPRIADSLFQLFKQADRCFLILGDKDDPNGKLVPKMIKTRRPGQESSASYSRTIARRCLETGDSLLSEDASADQKFGLAQSIADFRIRSVMLAPLCAVADGKPFGLIQLDTQDRTKKFSQNDLKLLKGVANQAAVALENVQMHASLMSQERARRDLDLARQVQRSFLPQTLPNLPSYQFFAHYEAALTIGGDYYDFVPRGHELCVMLGDVAGKGVAAALLMAKLSALARFCILTETEAAAAVTKLNDQLLMGDLLDKFVTFAVVILDPATHRATIVNAGHVVPLVYRQQTGSLDDAIGGDDSGLPLGVMPSYQYTSVQVELGPGDSLLLFTDGVTDAQNAQNKQERFEMTGVHAAIKQARTSPTEVVTPVKLGEKLIKTVKQYSAGISQYDDIALVCFGRNA